MQTEFEIIEKFFFKKKIKAYKGIGDDAALFKKDDDNLWAISTDTLNKNIHFMKQLPIHIKLDGRQWQLMFLIF